MGYRRPGARSGRQATQVTHGDTDSNVGPPSSRTPRTTGEPPAPPTEGRGQGVCIPTMRLLPAAREQPVARLPASAARAWPSSAPPSSLSSLASLSDLRRALSASTCRRALPPLAHLEGAGQALVQCVHARGRAVVHLPVEGQSSQRRFARSAPRAHLLGAASELPAASPARFQSAVTPLTHRHLAGQRLPALGAGRGLLPGCRAWGTGWRDSSGHDFLLQNTARRHPPPRRCDRLTMRLSPPVGIRSRPDRSCHKPGASVHPSTGRRTAACALRPVVGCSELRPFADAGAVVADEASGKSSRGR